MARLLQHNALRVEEACAADAADLGEDSDRRVLRVVGKGARKAEILLTPATVAAVEACLTARARRVGQGEWRQLRERAAGRGSARAICRSWCTDA